MPALFQCLQLSFYGLILGEMSIVCDGKRNGALPRSHLSYYREETRKGRKMKTIPLTKGKVALVSDCDYEYLSQFNWYLNSEGYAIREIWNGGNRVRVRMHREILGVPDGMDTDHIDRNRLNNQRENLRTCNRSQNLANKPKREDNKSGYKGVSWSKQNKKWTAQISKNRKIICIGHFDDIQKAAIAYNEAAKKYFGEFAFLNKIKE